MKNYAVSLVYSVFILNNLDDCYSMMELIQANSEEEALGKLMIQAKEEFHNRNIKCPVLRTFRVLEIK